MTEHTTNRKQQRVSCVFVLHTAQTAGGKVPALSVLQKLLSLLVRKSSTCTVFARQQLHSWP